MGIILSVDVGGTFTDLCLYNSETEELFIHKLLVTTHDPTEGVKKGITEISEKADISLNQIHRVIHGTTMITNALIERKGNSTGLITSEGFRDVIEIGNENRYNTFDL